MEQDLNLIVYRIHRGDHRAAAALPLAIDVIAWMDDAEIDLTQKHVLAPRKHLCTFNDHPTVDFRIRTHKSKIKID